MDAIGYSTWSERPEDHRPMRFSDRNSAGKGVLTLEDCLPAVCAAFSEASDCVWIVPGTHPDDPCTRP